MPVHTAPKQNQHKRRGFSALGIEHTDSDDERENTDSMAQEPLPTTPPQSRPTSRASKRSLREDDPENTPTKPPSKKPASQAAKLQAKPPQNPSATQQPIHALVLASSKTTTGKSPTQDIQNPYGNPFLIPATSPASPLAATSNLANGEWITTSPPPVPISTDPVTEILYHLQKAVDLMRQAEESDKDISWPASLYEKIRDLCDTRSTDKNKLAINLSHLGGSDVLIELAKQNANLSATVLSLLAEAPTRTLSQEPNAKTPKNSYAAAASRSMAPQTKLTTARPDPQATAFHKSRVILKFDPPWPHYQQTSPQELTEAFNTALKTSSAPETVRVKAVAHTKGGHLAVHASEPTTGDELLQYANHLTTQALACYPGRTPNTTCEAQPDIPYHRIQLNKAPTRDWGNNIIDNGNALLENLVSSNEGLLRKENFAELPKWAVFKEKLEQVYRAPIIISLKSEALAAEIQSKRTVPIFFQGTILTPSYYRQRAPIRQCRKCNSYRHGTMNCRETASCAICAGPHLTTDHKCNQCDASTLPCEHHPAKCANCGDPHTADNRRCKARKEAIEEAKDSNPKPDLSGIGNPSAPQQGTRATNAHNNSESQGGQKRKGRKPAPKGKKSRKTSEADTSTEGEMEVVPSVEGANAQ